MKNVKNKVYLKIQEDRLTSYDFIYKASIEVIKYNNNVLQLFEPIHDQIRHRDGVYNWVNVLLKNNK
jgi:cobyrinic acid a,c-diamide synthase